MKIEIKRLTEWNEVLNSARWTVNKEEISKEPSNEFKNDIIFAEHSPIRELVFTIKLYDVPTWVSQHIARHDAFADHNVREGVKDVHFVGTQRSDRTGIDRNKLTQDASCDHKIFLSAQDFINISRRRLCNCASKETKDLWKSIIKELSKTEPELAKHCVRECVYRNGLCPEKRKNCKFNQTEEFKKELDNYIN